jgi:ribosomal protein S18 acetylase RimI-like enzyme
VFAIERAAVEDAAAIYALQKQAYTSEAEIYRDYSIAPLVETMDEVTQSLQNHVYLKAVSGGQICGAVRGLEDGGSCFVGRLMVHPAMQNQGLGAKLLRELEKVFPGAARFELFTGQRSEKNIHLYEKLGYVIFRRETIHSGLDFVYMEKMRG